MVETYKPVVVFCALLLVIGAALLGIGILVRPRKFSRDKSTAYECGMIPATVGWKQFLPAYYIYAILLLVFDVAIVFLLCWIVVWERLGSWVIAEMFVFMSLLVLGLLYAWQRGALEWKKGGEKQHGNNG